MTGLLRLGEKQTPWPKVGENKLPKRTEFQVKGKVKGPPSEIGSNPQYTGTPPKSLIWPGFSTLRTVAATSSNAGRRNCPPIRDRRHDRHSYVEWKRDLRSNHLFRGGGYRYQQD
jgi:hypothetical protein